MKLYSSNDNYKLYQGNMLDMLETIEPNSIDSIITDPPYELNFMGKGWDNSGIAFQKETWEKCFEVLKSGGYLLAFGGSRTFHRIACAIEDAGFEIRDTIMWLYGSGFPKSMDISKSLDKRNGRNFNDDFRNYINNKRLDKNISLKEINEKLGLSTNGGGVASYIFNERQNNGLPTKEQYNILKYLLDLDDRYDELINTTEAEREVIGKRKSTAMDGYKWLGEKYKQSENNLIDITIPSTDLAKQWQGWGTALKPSFEPIIVARKPFKGSLVDNVIEYGVGGINIDECRVKAEEKLTRKLSINEPNVKINNSKKGQGSINDIADKLGRFPANTILTYDETDFDEVCGGFPNSKSNFSLPNREKSNCDVSVNIINSGAYKSGLHYGDNGSASRYFYCAKASKKDRDEGLEQFEEKLPACVTDFRPTLASNPENWNNGEPVDNPMMRTTPRKNIHPTVKPTELMQYLIRLITPEGGIVLDPFNGSGSTGKAVMYENKERNKNYKYIGIELTEEYLPISKARIEFVCNLKEEEIKEMQLSIFDYKE